MIVDQKLKRNCKVMSIYQMKVLVLFLNLIVLVLFCTFFIYFHKHIFVVSFLHNHVSVLCWHYQYTQLYLFFYSSFFFLSISCYFANAHGFKMTKVASFEYPFMNQIFFASKQLSLDASNSLALLKLTGKILMLKFE